MSIADEEITDEYRFRELRSRILTGLRSISTTNESLRDNHIDSIVDDIITARKILDSWGAFAPHRDQYLITGFHEELSWCYNQCTSLRVIKKKKRSTPKLHKHQTVLLG